MPGCYVTDHQMRLYMKLRQTDRPTDYEHALDMIETAADALLARITANTRP